MAAMIQILLIHNPLGLRPLYWFSFLIRVLTGSRWNHAALLIDGEVWESVAEGVKRTDFEVWKKATRRKIKALHIDLADYGTTREAFKKKLWQADPYPYGYFDLLPFFWRQLVLYRWLGRDQQWSGKAWREGYFCSEFVAKVLGMDNAHLYSPEALQSLPYILTAEEFTT